MKVIIYVGHPSQYLFFRKTIETLLDKKHKVILLLKTKDVLEPLVKNDGFDYINVLPQIRGNSKFSIIVSLIKRNFRILPIILKEKPDLLIGSDPSISQLGWLLRRDRIALTEDDYSIIKPLANITFPFSQAVLSPNVCELGKWTKKKIGYDGYMKLAYLHPDIFQPNPSFLTKYNIKTKFALIRLSLLAAHHDFGIKGIPNKLLDQIITKLSNKNINVYISSEYELCNKYEEYKLKIEPKHLHHILSQATILISDSQSMSVEAAMLGTPSLRYSDFAGKISVLEELEHKYSLTFGFPSGQDVELLKKLNELIENDRIKQLFVEKRQNMLLDKINVSEFLSWLILNWPKSLRRLKLDPKYSLKFK